MIDSSRETLAAVLARQGDDALVVTDASLRVVEASAEAARRWLNDRLPTSVA